MQHAATPCGRRGQARCRAAVLHSALPARCHALCPGCVWAACDRLPPLLLLDHAVPIVLRHHATRCVTLLGASCRGVGTKLAARARAALGVVTHRARRRHAPRSARPGRQTCIAQPRSTGGPARSGVVRGHPRGVRGWRCVAAATQAGAPLGRADCGSDSPQFPPFTAISVFLRNFSDSLARSASARASGALVRTGAGLCHSGFRRPTMGGGGRFAVGVWCGFPLQPSRTG